MALGDGIRRNVAAVSSEERNRLRDAIIALNHPPQVYPGSGDDTPIPGGVSFWFKQDEIHQATHVHHGPNFLPWHRELCNRFEALLRGVDPLLSLHYWDWTTNPEDFFTPTFMGGAHGAAGQPWLDEGFYDPSAPVNRDRDSSGNPADPPISLTRELGSNGFGRLSTKDIDEAIISAATFPEMRLLVEDAHDRVHVWIGGDIANAHVSFRDPFVFLLHSNVDRLFARWQTDPEQPWRLDPEQVYGAEGNTTGRDGILAPLDPWAGNPLNDPGIIRIRPWAPPENQMVVKNSKDLSVVTPPVYDTNFTPKQLLAAEGVVTFLRVHDVGTGFGPDEDFIDVEAVIGLDSQPGMGFGFQLRPGPDEEAHRHMLDLLRTAFNRNRRVSIDYEISLGKRNGQIIRVTDVV